MRPYVLAALVGLVGCGIPDPNGTDADDGETGDGPEAATFPDIELDQWCADVDSPPLNLIETNYGKAFNEPLDVGPCGHIVYGSYQDDAFDYWLLDPDGTREPVDFPASVFDATGRLLFLYEGGSPHFELHDLGTGTVHTFQGPYSGHGFVRSTDPEHPTVAWACGGDGRLSIVHANQTTELMTGITHCERVTGSEGNSKLLVPHDEQVYVVDVDTGEQLATEIDFLNGFDGNGGERVDSLEINYTGSLAAHHFVLWGTEKCPSGDCSTYESRIIDVADGRAIAVCEYAAFQQARTEHAPAFLRCDDDLWVWHEGKLVPLDGGAVLRLSDPGTAVVAEELGEEYQVSWVSAENPTEVESIGIASASALPEISASGEAVAYGRETDVCADPDCTGYLIELHQWTAEGGGGPSAWFAGEMEIGLVFDDSSLLAFGVLVDGPVDGPLPPPVLSLIDVTGQVVRQWDFGIDDFSSVEPLADGRFLVTTGANQETEVWTIDLAAPTDEPSHMLGPLETELPILDGRRRRLVVEAGQELYWGEI